MNRDRKFVIAIVVSALLCGFIPAFLRVGLGMGIGRGWLSPQLFQSLVFNVQIPAIDLAIPVIGLLLSLYFRSRNLKKYRLTAIAFSVIVVGVILTAVLSAWVQVNFVQSGSSTSQIGRGYFAVSCVRALAQIISWILLFITIFSQKINAESPANSP